MHAIAEHTPGEEYTNHLRKAFNGAEAYGKTRHGALQEGGVESSCIVFPMMGSQKRESNP
ncbi:MAG: hypothetical protein QM442_01305 [Spirochaetota bacterium]|nr:hypothetical protein [Spirochaetota bacterium]